jgi:hypothetical protein
MANPQALEHCFVAEMTDRNGMKTEETFWTPQGALRRVENDKTLVRVDVWYYPGGGRERKLSFSLVEDEMIVDGEK